MPLIHIVLFEFKAGTSKEKINDVCQNFLALQENCIHPTSKTAYLKSVKGGKNNSPEPFQYGLTHGFVIEFESEFDRKYYLDEDPIHKAFVESVQGIMEQIRVVDFWPGEF